MANEFTADIDLIAAEFLSYPTVTFLAEEGQLDVTSRRIGQSGAKDKTHGYVAEIEKGNLVECDPTADWVVQNRTNTNPQPLGIAHVQSEPAEGIELLELLDEDNSPFAAPDTLNQVVVEVFGFVIRKWLMGVGATAVVPGDGVLWHVTAGQENTVNKGAAGNGTMVILGGAATEEIVVVMHHLGALA